MPRNVVWGGSTQYVLKHSLCLLYVRCVHSNVRLCVCVCFRAYSSLQHAPCAWFRKDGVDYSSGGGVSAHLPLPHSAAGRPRLLEVRHWSTLTNWLTTGVTLTLWMNHWFPEQLLIDTRLILWLNHGKPHRRMALPWCDTLKHFICFIALEFGYHVYFRVHLCVFVSIWILQLVVYHSGAPGVPWAPRGGIKTS